MINQVIYEHIDCWVFLINLKNTAQIVFNAQKANISKNLQNRALKLNLHQFCWASNFDIASKDSERPMTLSIYGCCLLIEMVYFFSWTLKRVDLWKQSVAKNTTEQEQQAISKLCANFDFKQTGIDA